MDENKRMSHLVSLAKEKIESADRLFNASTKIYITLKLLLDEEIRDLEEELNYQSQRSPVK